MLKWKAYWITLFAILGAMLYWKNYKFYRDKPRYWLWIKTIVEGCMLVLCSIYAVPLLILYACMWLTKPIKKPVLKATVGFFLAIPLMIFGSVALELLIIIGVFGVECLSGEFLMYINERKDKRLNRMVA